MKRRTYQRWVLPLICLGAIHTAPLALASPFGNEEPAPDSLVCTSGKYSYVLDFSGGPDLKEWTVQTLMPVMAEWYPKVVSLVTVRGTTPPDTIYFELKEASDMPAEARALPGHAQGDRVMLNATVLRGAKKTEAIGSVLREIVYVAQFNAQPSATTERPPAWVFKGAAEYVRAFLYEPKIKTPQVTPDNVATMKHDESEQMSAHFIDWVIKNHQKDLLPKISQSIQKGYTDSLWKEWTGKSVQELETEWQAANAKSLGLAKVGN